MWWWWWAWVAFVVILFVLPWSYGWTRRGWGPPYPSYYRRRLYGRPPVAAGPPEYDPAAASRVDDPRLVQDPADQRYPSTGWSWLADLLWIGVLVAIGWGIYLWLT